MMYKGFIISAVIFSAVFFINLQPISAENSSLTFLNRILNYSGKEADKSLERLSGGRILLIDDPANYAIYEKLEKFVREFERLIGNQSDMLSYYRLEDSLIGNIVEVLQRIRELVLQKSNGILNDSDKELINSEISQQYDQVLLTLEQGEFNTKKIFAGVLETNIIKGQFKDKEYYELGNVDKLLDFFIKERAVLGAVMKSLEFQINGERIAGENTAEMQGHGDTEFGSELSNLKRRELLMMVNILMLKQAKP
jgi:flagellin-like hook-associated protein FlgL